VGTFEDGIERPRIQVTLATGSSEAECRAVNPSYRDPATIDPQVWLRGADPDRLVPRAGEHFDRLQSSKTKG
jgi:lactate racemase